MKNTLHSLLKHHVTGAIERGEAQPIVEIPAIISAAPDLLSALETLLSRSVSLDQSATHDGLQNCAAIAQARETLRKAKEIVKTAEEKAAQIASQAEKHAAIVRESLRRDLQRAADIL